MRPKVTKNNLPLLKHTNKQRESTRIKEIDFNPHFPKCKKAKKSRK